MADRSIVVRLRAEVSDFRRDMHNVRGDVEQLSESALKNQSAWNTVGVALTAFGVGTAALLASTGRAAITWETAWTGVLKTVDGSAEQLERLQGDLRQMALEVPASAVEIAGVAEAAGQLGIKVDDVAAFTRTMINLGYTTNLSADQAATALARVANIMGTLPDDISRMGSTIVDLGNNSATTEAEIVDFSTRLAAAARQAGLTEAQMFAFASTLTSVGVEADAGGTAMSKVFTSVADAVRSGNDDLEVFARVAGISAADFKTAFETDAASAIAMFIDGMGRMSRAGESTTEIFDTLGLTDQRLMRAVLSAGSAQGLLTRQLKLATNAWEENSALTAEADKRYATAASKIQVAKNAVFELAVSMGEHLLPIIGWVADRFADVAEWLSNLPAPVQILVAAIGGLVAIAAILGGGFLLLYPRIVQVRLGFEHLAMSSPGAAAALTRVGTVAKYTTLSLGAVGVVLGIASAAMAIFGGSNADAEARVKSLTDSLDKQTGAITDSTRSLVIQRLEEQGALEMASHIGIALDTVTDAALGNEDAMRLVNEQVKTFLENGGDTLQTVTTLIGPLNSANKELDASQESWGRVAEATGDASDATENATASVIDYNQALTDQIELQRKAAGIALDQREALRRVEEAIDDADARMGEDGWIRTLDAGTEAGRDNQRALDDIASSTLDLVAAMDAAEATEVEMQAAAQRGREEFVRVAQQFGATSDEAAALADQLGLIPETITVDVNADLSDFERAMLDIQRQIREIPPAMNAALSGKTYTPTVSKPYWQQRASGGPVWGPGTSTSDSIPAMLSTNEHVWSAAEVAGAGGHGAVAAMRAWARGGLADGGYMTTGGTVASGLPTNFASSLAAGIASRLGDTINFTIHEASDGERIASEVARLFAFRGA